MPEASSDLVHAYRMARDGACRHGEITLSRMSRLASLLCDDRGAARFELEFHLDSHARPLISGRVQATLGVICQRCLEPMRLELDLELELGIVRSDEEAVALSKEYEPLTLETDTLSLATLVEDELILALPAAPLHPPGTCRAPRDASAEAQASGEGGRSDVAGRSSKPEKASE